MSPSHVYRCMRFAFVLPLLFACVKSSTDTLPPEAPPSPNEVVLKTVQPQRVAVGAPIELTASDGTGLGLVSLSATAVIDQPLAFTELHLVFDNPQDRRIEGQFRITLPERASISRFAMLTDGSWQEGEVVERQAARRAYEDFLHRRQDPALLEQQGGNEFSARIFPIPAHAQKEIVIAYSEELLGDSYSLALAGLPRVGRVDVRATEGAKVDALHLDDEVPSADFAVTTQAHGNVALRHDNLLVARVTPVTETQDDPVESLFVLVDTSASRALGHSADVALVRELLGKVGDIPVAIWAFDQEAVLLGEGKASQLDLSKLEQRRPLGASNIGLALAEVAKHGKTYTRGVVVSDGVVTAGEDKLADAVVATGARRFDAIAVGGIRDRDALQRLVMGSGLVIDGARGAAFVASRMSHKTQSGIPVDIPGAAWTWPEKLDGMQPGDTALVYADLGSARSFSMAVGGRAIPAGSLRETARPLLERAWASARIKRLLDQRERTADRDVREALSKQVVDISTKMRVLCPLTALLVLESDDDYARFHIDRNALANILVIEKDRVVVKSRTSRSAVAVAAPARSQVDAVRKGRERTGAPVPEESSDEALVEAPGGAAPVDAESEDDADGTDADAPKRAMVERPAADLAQAAPPPPAPAAMAREEARMDEPVGRGGGVAPSSTSRSARMPSLGTEARHSSRPAPRPVAVAKSEQASPYTGKFRTVMDAVERGARDEALGVAQAWWAESPGDVMALTAFGEALEAAEQFDEAARAYGSLIDLFPARADMRRFAGERLERVKGRAALILAIDTYAKAVEQRPDHPESHRLLAYALLKAGEPARAFEALEVASRQTYPESRFAGVDKILSEDLGLAAQVWIKAQPSEAQAIYARLDKAGGRRETGPSLRFVLAWETDANDVDFHIYDSRGGHAYYSEKQLPSGGELYADVTTGYGPECFTIRGTQRAFPYKLQAHYYSRGPMGYGMGKLEIVQHDGRGNLVFDERPFVVMQDHAFLELGNVSRPL